MSNYTYKPSGEAIGRIEVFEPKPKIAFQMGDSTEVMRLTKDGVWVNPDIKPEEAAQAVLSALDAQIKTMVKKAVEEEREACAKVCETLWDTPTNAMATEEECYGAECAAAIRARSNT